LTGQLILYLTLNLSYRIASIHNTPPIPIASPPNDTFDSIQIDGFDERSFLAVKDTVFFCFIHALNDGKDNC
jgi:hypothetical protein